VTLTVREALARGRATLRGVPNITETPDLDAEVLLRHALRQDRAALFTRLHEPLDTAREAEYFGLVERRRRGEPVAYITGEREFMGLRLLVDGRVLIPRPETETLVERALGHLSNRGAGKTVVDVGTGSGAIAVALAHLAPQARVYGTDTSSDALSVAEANARLDGRSLPNLTLVRGNLLHGVPGGLDLVCANLPYIPTGEMGGLPVPVRDFEPWSALDGGPDGLDVYRALLDQLAEKLAGDGVALMECDPEQAGALAGLALEALPGGSVHIVRDLAGAERVVEVRR
jgi:release factor glutamine methyltransferase